MVFFEQIGRFAHFAAGVVAAVGGAALRPSQFLRPLYETMAGALPLGLAAGGALGVVVWLHLHSAVSREYQQRVPEFLALAVVLEFAPLGAGLVVAGRSGASLGAELSSMRLTEQLDALQALGVSPMQRLVGPRVLACMMTLPVLTVLIAFVALASSLAAEMLGGSLSWTQYQTALLRGLGDAPDLSATLKTIAFGFLIGVAGCYCGLNAPEGAEGVGIAATRGVVWATLLVLLSNVVLVKVIQLVTRVVAA
jgi:phospholipid/cholesterol/gamma-HCH transport system permease protein